MAPSAPAFTPLVQQLPASVPFVGPETMERARGRVFKARIGANESAFGISPRAQAAMEAAVREISNYSDPEGYDLRAALAQHHGVAMDEIMLGSGIDELLGLLVRLLALPGMPVVTSLGAYPTFNYHVAGFGAQLVTVPYRDDHEDPEALLNKVRETKAPLVYLANPDNPMGTWHDAARIQSFIDALPEGTLLVLDEAYVEFAPEGTAPPIDTSNPQVIRMRTFSKAHGMAGARIGYAIGAREVIGSFHKVRNHFGINRVAQAGALASLQDPEFLQSVIRAVEEGRQETYALASSLGLSAIPSATNFVALDLGSGERARAALATLTDADIFIRMPGVAPQDRCIRVTVGTAADRAVFAQTFTEVLHALGV